MVPDVSCECYTREDGVKICTLHGPLITKAQAEAEARGFTVFMDAPWVCPEKGTPFSFVVDALHDEIAEGEAV